MQSEAHSNVYQIFIREMNWKRPVRFFGGGRGGRGKGAVYYSGSWFARWHFGIVHFSFSFLCVYKRYLYPASVNEMPAPIAMFCDYVDWSQNTL